MKSIACTAFTAACLALGPGSALAVDSQDKTERKHITVVTAEGRAETGSEISRETLKECIVSLPSEAALEPVVGAESKFLQEINGDATKNGWTKLYTARISANYQLYRKEMIIVTVKSLEGKEPTMKEVEKRLPQKVEIVSDPTEGEFFAGRSRREYFFPKAEDAVKDAKKRAQIWLKQQQPLLCAEK